MKRVIILVALPVVLYLIVFALAPESMGVGVIASLLQLAILPAILAWGVAFALKLGIWDFSVGGVVLVSAIVGGQIANIFELGIPGLIVACSLTGLAVGAVTGVLFRLLRIPSVILTIGMMLLLESVAAVIFNGRGVLMSVDTLKLGSFPVNIIVGVAVFAFAYMLYNHTTFGYRVRSVGNNIRIARMNGVNVDRVRHLGFMVVGLFAGFYAFMNLGTTGIASPVTNMQTLSIVFDAIICVFIALALERYTNLMVGVYIGSICVQIIKVGIVALGISGLFQQAVIALFLLLAMAFSAKSDEVRAWLERLRGRSSREPAPVA